MSKAPKIPHEQWEAYRDVIKTLYLEQNKTIKEIGKFMSENYQFYATEKQYIRKVTVNWKLRKNTKKEEWEQASTLVLKRKAAGKPTELTIHGKIIPDKKRKKETRRYAPKNLVGSPTFTVLETVVARTPPTVNQNITYFTIPWFNLQARLTSPAFRDGVYPTLNGTLESIQRSMACSLPFFQNQVSTSSTTASFLSSIGNSGALDLDPDMLMLFDEQITFDHRYQNEVQNQETPVTGSWSRLFFSLVFLSSNNLLNEDFLAEFLKLAISCGFLHDLKQVLSFHGLTMRLFSVALLSAALDVPGEEGFQIVHYLLQQGVNSNSVYSHPPPLWRAVRSENEAAVRLLLDHGAEPLASFLSLRLHIPWQIESYDNTSLAKALIHMRHDILREINPRRSIFLPTPIFLAVEAGDESRVRSLFQVGADTNLLDPKYLSLLHVAVGCGNSSMIDLLIEFGADPDFLCQDGIMETLILTQPQAFGFISHYPYSIATPLQLAVERGELDLVRQLLRAGAKPDGAVNLDILGNSKTNYHDKDFALTALQIAGRESEYGIMKVLLEAGAGVDTRHVMQSTTLQYACGLDCGSPNKMDIVKLLLRWGADLNASPSQENGKSSLEAAAGVGDVDLMKMLLRKGATCSNPASILQAAISSGSTKPINFLIDRFSKAGLSAVDITDNWSEYLETAAKTGNVRLLNEILNLCVDERKGLYEKHVIDAMETAVDYDQTGILSYLLMSRVDPDADGRACRILSKAMQLSTSERGDSCFALLMSQFTALGLDLDKPLPGDATPLCTAICLRNWTATQCLVLSGVDVDKPSLRYVEPEDEPDDDMRSNKLEPPILQAIRVDEYYDDGVSLTDLLIVNGVNIDYIVDENKTALLLALTSGKYEFAETLLEHGANPNAEDPETGMDAFDCIFENDRWPPFSTFKLLIEHGFQVKAESNGGILIRVVAETSLGGAIHDRGRWNVFAPVLSLLLGAGAEVNARQTEEYPMTALQCAADANHKELVTILLNAGADIYAPAFWKEGKTTLQAACSGGNLELVQDLVTQGLDINAQPASHYGATALQFAAMQGHLKTAIFLLENGASINASTALVGGRTALQGAAEHGRLDMIYLLLENDQDDGLEERCQKAAKFAEVESRFEIAQILRQYRKF